MPSPRASVTAVAHPNIALLKYWGKQPGVGNVPATPSLSITLDGLASETRVADGDEDRFCLNGRVREDAKLAAALAVWRQQHAIPPLSIDSSNNFPTAAGLASSASGFAALAVAVDAHCGLGLSRNQLSELARLGSASAARSLCGGFASLGPPDWQAEELAPASAWPLQVLIAVTADQPKPVSSTDGMARTRDTSPYYDAWVAGADADFQAMLQAFRGRDFTALAELGAASSMKMHALMLTSRPPLIYWTGASVACLSAVEALRARGCPVFATMDAGPQVKAVCEPDAADEVAAALEQIPGVIRLLKTGLGAGARIVPGSEGA